MNTFTAPASAVKPGDRYLSSTTGEILETLAVEGLPDALVHLSEDERAEFEGNRYIQIKVRRPDGREHWTVANATFPLEFVTP